MSQEESNSKSGDQSTPVPQGADEQAVARPSKHKKKKTPKNEEREMPFFDHIDELRKRVMYSIYIFLLGFGVAWVGAKEYVLDFLRAPLFKIMAETEQKLHFTSLFENFLTHLKISAVTGIFICAPFFFYQIWAFIAPGLYERERKMVVPFITMATLFFVGGAAFAYFVLFPVAFKFFVEFGSPSDVPLLTISSYYTTVLKLLLLFGASFELPVLVVFLGYLGVIDKDFLQKNRQGAIIGITVACAMFAPPDAISMIIMMIPLILLYEAAIHVVGWLGVKRKQGFESENESEE